MRATRRPRTFSSRPRTLAKRPRPITLGLEVHYTKICRTAVPTEKSRVVWG